MSEMIEIVARALAAANGYDPDNVPNNPLEPDANPAWHKYKYDAEIAIAAMRDPSDAMMDALMDTKLNYVVLADDGISVYRAMIDAALK